MRGEKKQKQEHSKKAVSVAATEAAAKINEGISQAIPQHKLRDREGKDVNFDISILGKANQKYDFEKPHRHDFYEILLFNEGGGIHDIDFETFPILNRSAHFVASHNVHLILREKNSTGYSLLFTPDYFNQDLISQLPFSKPHPVVKLNDTEFKVIQGLIDHIRTEQLNKEPGFENIVKTYMDAVALNLLRAYRKQTPQQEKQIAKPQLVRNFMQLVQQHYLHNYNVEDYSEKLNVSSKHLIEICKQHTGKTPLAYIRDHIISEAKRLLYHTQLSIKEVAYKLNFEDPTNFSKYFKTATGYTPVEYREGIR